MLIEHATCAETADKQNNLWGIALLIASLIGAGMAQITLTLAVQTLDFWQLENWLPNFLHNSSPLPGLFLYAISASMFIRGLSLCGHIPSQFNFSVLEQMPTSPRFGFWVTCLGLSALTAGFAASPSANLNGYALAATWIGNIGLLIFSTWREIDWHLPSTKKTAQWLREHLPELFGILLIIAIAFMIRFWNVELHPYSFINDEGEMGNSGVCVIQGACHNLFDIGWAGQPMLAFVPTGMSVSLFGRTATAVRLVSVIIGCLAVLAVYLFTREAFGKRESWLAMILLATLPVHVHFSRLGVDNIIDSLSTTAVLGFLFLGMKRGSTMAFLVAGILGGLCMYTYPGSRLAPILGLSVLGYISLRKHGFLKVYLQNIIIFIFSLIVTAAPIVGYFLANPNIFFARMQDEGIFNNQAFANSLQSGTGLIGLLTEQFLKSFLAFFVTSSPYNFFNSPKPYLTFLASIFFILGLAYMIWRIKDERYFVLFIWFFAEVILGSTLTGGPPTSQRMLMSMPALTVIIAIGASKITENIGRDGTSTRWLQTAGLLIFVIWTGYKDIHFYHYEYRMGHYFEDPTNEFSYETAAMISPLHTSGRLYLITDSTIPYLSFANFDYFSPDVEKQYLNEVTLKSLADLKKDKDALFIATPDKLDDLKHLASMLPGGIWTEFKRRYQPALVLYYSYKIKQSDWRSFQP